MPGVHRSGSHAAKHANHTMLTFLFWNSKSAPTEIIGELVAEHGADVLMLVETKHDDAAILSAIQRIDGTSFSRDASPARVALYTRFSTRNAVTLELDMPKMSMRSIRTQQESLLLVVAHLLSKTNASDDEQSSLIPTYAREISRIETKIGHQRTVLVGDLNMDPFEKGIVQATGFHAIPSHRIAVERGKRGSKGGREVEGLYYPYFYNPMWNCFGDERNGPPGTYFRDKGGPIAYFWHMYDQVLIRPSLVPRFRHQDLKILTRTRTKSLLNGKNQPDVDNASDHLPILFRLELDPIGVSR